MSEQRLRNDYDKPLLISYVFSAINFGSTVNKRIKPPPGAKFGEIKDVHASINTLFTQVTTPGYVRIGTVDDASKYCSMNMGAAAANTGYGLADNDGLGTKQKTIDLDRDSNAGTAITDLRVAFIAPTGGSPAGVADVTITMAWW